MSTQLNRRERKAAQLLKHYATCEALARHLGHPNPDGKKISVALFKLERVTHSAAEAYCNGDDCFLLLWGGSQHRLNFRDDSDKSWNMVNAYADEEIARIFGLPMTASGPGVIPGFFVNGDPRGYSLKIDNEKPEGKALIEAMKLHTDWGGYGILSPEITGN